MSPDPNISVILPVYNGEKYIREAIDSVLAQTYQDFELIVFDDGSTDATSEIVSKYAKSDSRVLLYSRENRGLVATLNEAISLAKGSYIARLDADDICYPDRLEKQYHTMLDADLDILGGSVDLLEGSEISTRMHYRTCSDDIKASIITWGRNFCHPAVMYKKTMHDRYPYEQYPGIEDFVLWIRLALDRSIKMGNLDEPVIKYRVHSGQTTQIDKDKTWHLTHQREMMKEVVCDAIGNVNPEWIDSFEKLLRPRKRFIGQKDIRNSFKYIDTITNSKYLSFKAKTYFLIIIYKRIKKKSRPKNKRFILYRLKKRIRVLDINNMMPGYQFNE